MENRSHLARYAVTNSYVGQFAWFVSEGDAQDFITALGGKPGYYSIERVD